MKRSILEILGLSKKSNHTTPKEESMENMFCYQCEQAANGGCTKVGVCGKQPDVAALQDLLVYAMKGIAFYADKARAQGKKDQEIDRFMLDGLFTTVTNVDFEKWPDYLADGPLAMAFLDRLVEGAIILKINGKSFRARRPRADDDANDPFLDSPRSTTQP